MQDPLTLAPASADKLASLNPHPAPHGEWFRPLTPGEIGCFLSHLRCWELIQAQDTGVGIVLEDDFDLTGD